MMRPTVGQTRFLVRVDWLYRRDADTEIARVELVRYLPLNRPGENMGDYEFPKAKVA
jgi:hypothetical protein